MFAYFFETRNNKLTKPKRINKKKHIHRMRKKIMFSLEIAVIFRFAPNSFYKFKYWIEDIQIDSSINHWLNQYAQEIIWIIT